MKKGSVIKTLKIIGNVLFYSVIVFLMIFSISNITIESEVDIPNIFGKGFLSVQSDSMNTDRPDGFKKGDLVYIDILSEEAKSNLQPGQIIVFWHQNMHKIHRIVDIGEDMVITQGDVASDMYGAYTDMKDNMSPNYAQTLEVVNFENVIGIYTGQTKDLGEIVDTLRDPNGFLLWIVLPLLLFFLYEMIMLAVHIIQRNKVKLQEKHEKEKEALKAELLAQLQAQQQNQ
jgi:signal peptidase